MITFNRRERSFLAEYALHSLRVYGISYLMELGVPLAIVQMIVGHKTPAMTILYTKFEPKHVKKMLAGKVSAQQILGNWDEIAADLMNSRPELITTNPGFLESEIPRDVIEKGYTGSIPKPGGFCFLGGDGCDIGQIKNEIGLNGRLKFGFGPVVGGCGNCRFLGSSPAFLFQHVMVVNDIFIEIRSIGKQQSAAAQKLKYVKLSGEQESNLELEELQAKIEDLERHIEPKIREWVNRTKMINEMLEKLDDYLDFISAQSNGDGNNIIVSNATVEDFSTQIEIRMEKTGEFELARQTLLAAHLHGGIEQCSELSRSQVREFMDRIMIHEDSRYLLLRIANPETRDKVAFLMAETMANMVGSDVVQTALDSGTGLELQDQQKKDLEVFVASLFKNAEAANEKVSYSSLLPEVYRGKDLGDDGFES